MTDQLARGNPSDRLSPRQARREFLNSKKGSIKESSRRAYEYPTKSFVEFCEEHGIETTGEVDGYVLTSWKERRRQEIKPITLHNNVKHLRVFLKWAARSELMEQHIHEKLAVPDVPDDEVRSHDMLDLEQAEATLRYLKTYEYATRKHAMFYTLWHTGCRVSGAISLDVGDVVNQSGDYIITFRNRRSTGTALKNGNSGERNVSITESLWNVLQDYLEGPHRNQVEDEYGREPLFTTPKNRISRGTAYKDYTAITRPCVVTNSCPHNRLIDDCEPAQRKQDAMKCPSSVSLHPIRRGAITYQINRGWPKEKLSERTDVSVEVLEKHYDARTQEEQREGRKQHLDLLE